MFFLRSVRGNVGETLMMRIHGRKAVKPGGDWLNVLVFWCNLVIGIGKREVSVEHAGAAAEGVATV